MGIKFVLARFVVGSHLDADVEQLVREAAMQDRQLGRLAIF